MKNKKNILLIIFVIVIFIVSFIGATLIIKDNNQKNNYQRSETTSTTTSNTTSTVKTTETKTSTSTASTTTSTTSTTKAVTTSTTKSTKSTTSIAKKSTTKTTKKTTTTKSGELSSSEKEAAARKIAKEIASKATGSNDLEKIQSAAYMVAIYANKANYTNEDKDYKTAYGVFIKGVYTCAGTARALGMVLEEMGYKWQHVNANQYTHQWVELTIDGQKGWADAFPTLLIGGKSAMAGYGDYPYA